MPDDGHYSDFVAVTSIPDVVIASKKIDPVSKAVFAYLIMNAKGKTPPYPLSPDMATREMGVSYPTLRKRLSALHDAELIDLRLYPMEYWLPRFTPEWF